MKPIPTYKDCVEICEVETPVFYESKFVVDGFNISVFNYRLAQFKDFETPIKDRNDIDGRELRGLTFVFNTDGSLFNRYLLLGKFFNLNQTPESLYSVVKDYKIKHINNKEDGSVATFVKLPNGRVIGKSKMGFDNDQANGINRIYLNNRDVKSFVNFCLDNDIIPVFEYVAPSNRIVLRYLENDLILLRMRDNTTGKYLDINDYSDKIGNINVAKFEENIDLDDLINLVATQIDKEGSVVHVEDNNGNDFFYKLKTPWYCERHGLLTEDIYRENILIGYVLDDKIDDILGQIPEDEVEARIRIDKIINVMKIAINEKVEDIKNFYENYIALNYNRKDFAIKYHKDPMFGMTMAYVDGIELKKLTREEVDIIYKGDFERYDSYIERCDVYSIAKAELVESTKKLMKAREWLEKRDSSIFFMDPVINDEEN